MIPGIVLDSLFGRHSGPRVRPLWPVGGRVLGEIADAGFEFVQFSAAVRCSPTRCRAVGLDAVTGLTWQLSPGDRNLEAGLGRAADAGFDLASVLIGGGLLPYDAAAERVERLLSAAAAAGVDVCLETHRATVTESLAQTCRLASDFPALRFNLDLSHWFISHRLDAQAPDAFISAAAPVLDRCVLVHGRIAGASDVQVPVSEAAHADFFRTVWRDVARRSPGARFAPELLPAWMGYGRDDRAHDRWADTKTMIEWTCHD